MDRPDTFGFVSGGCKVTKGLLTSIDF